jgi:uncharacterized protein YndB with AHSA1/START domain
MIKCPIHHKTRINADIETVFKYIATAEGLDKWFTTGTKLDQYKGGTVKFVWVNWGVDQVNADSGGEILNYDPPNRFTFNWWYDKPTVVDISLLSQDGFTVIEVNETGYENSEEGIERLIDCSTGWGEALTLLKFYIEHKVTY